MKRSKPHAWAMIASNLDAIKAMKKGNREAYMEIKGPGFHSDNHVHKSAKTYTRKLKHKGNF